MIKGLEALESLDKLEECAYAMKDLPMSNWIDLAENEAELDLKIMNWVETIKLELFKGKQALDRLENLEKIFSDSHICEIKARFDEIECSADKCENCPLGIGDGICLKKTFERKWELQKENQELIKKADCCLWKDCNKISQENAKLKKAIEIIKKKNVDIEYIKTCFYDEKGGMKEYNSWVGHDENRALTQQEYNLLKEVLGE